MVWNLLGSSASVLMTDLEWHQAAFPTTSILRRTSRTLFRARLLSPDGRAFRALQTEIAPVLARRLTDAVSSADVEEKPEAQLLSVKLMDYNLMYLPALEAGFGSSRPLVLARHPLSQCESLMRSGLSLPQACQWYRDVATLMSWVATKWDAPIFKFEEFVHDPLELIDRVYANFDLSRPPAAVYRVKNKGYGSSRQGNVDMAIEQICIGRDQLRDFVDPTVNEAAKSRLTEGDQYKIWLLTQDSAGPLGYGI